MSETRPHWVQLAAELRRLRELCGLSQRAVATALGTSQPTVYRFEEAGGATPPGQPPNWPQVRKWAQACAEADPDLAYLRELTEAARNEHFDYRNLMSRGLAPVQEEVRAEESVARTLKHFNNWCVPGLLQTPEYAQHILRLTDFKRRGGIEAAVEARMRRQEILADHTRHLEFIVTESVLHWPPGPAPALRGQLEHLMVAAARPAVTLSVIPAGIATYAAPTEAFVLYEDLIDGGDPWVAVETHHTRVTADKPEDVKIYQDQYELLRRSAVTGDEARRLISAAAEVLREGH